MRNTNSYYIISSRIESGYGVPKIWLDNKIEDRARKSIIKISRIIIPNKYGW